MPTLSLKADLHSGNKLKNFKLYNQLLLGFCDLSDVSLSERSRQSSAISVVGCYFIYTLNRDR